MNSVMSFEAPHVKRDVPQWQRCQKFGRTKNYCHNNPRYVKCIRNLHTNKRGAIRKLKIKTCYQLQRACSLCTASAKAIFNTNRNSNHSPIIYPQFVQTRYLLSRENTSVCRNKQYTTSWHWRFHNHTTRNWHHWTKNNHVRPNNINVFIILPCSSAKL